MTGGRLATIVDGLVFAGDGWNDLLADSQLGALHVTAADFLADFPCTCDQIMSWWETFDRDKRWLYPILSTTDLDAVGTEARVGIVLGLQNAAPIDASPGRIEMLWRLGIRVLQLTYNASNQIAGGCLDRRDAGLTSLGRAVVSECNKTGMLIDLSHVGERSARETIERSSSAVAITHANRAARVPNPRNKSDELLLAVAASGGVIGVSPYGPMCWTGDRYPTLEWFVELVLDMVDLVGPDCVAIGTDFPAIASRERLGEILDRSLDFYPEIFGMYAEAFGNGIESRYCDGMKSVADWVRILPAVTTANLDDATIRKLLGGNWLRVYREAWSRREARPIGAPASAREDGATGCRD